jgi:hypothetical protein
MFGSCGMWYRYFRIQNAMLSWSQPILLDECDASSTNPSAVDFPRMSKGSIETRLRWRVAQVV